MKIGVYGGTFNPIHLGHVHILGEFIRRLGLDKALVIPTGTPPHKEAPELARGEDRAAMCALALENLPEAEVSTLEMERVGRSYTADTLELLERRFPEDQLYLLMGEDMFLTVDSWYRPEAICRAACLCASPRSQGGLCKLKEQQARLEERFGARCFVEDIPYFPASSTEIRRRLREGKGLGGLVPEAVERYIHERGLYAPGKEQAG